VILTGALAQPLQEPLWLGPAAGVFSSCPGQSDPAVRPPTRRWRWASCRSLLTVIYAQARGSSDDFASALVAHGSGLGKQRWVVERSFAWLHAFKRLRTRYERRADIHLGLLQLACALICYRRLRSF
jgi:transposase